MPVDLSGKFRREMLRLRYPRWSVADLDAYLTWRDDSGPSTWAHIVRLWRTLRKGRTK